ncbi:MAG: sodium:solute symporter [Flavobacteriaceae bacterium CG_4_8_14_3_um_filter_34_10]|nr:sodium:solute symporter family protein [Flavobacteriia bacterium]OIP51915.1 MAG: sodium:solute symporter [Flavobacteriaceae bacterium CG2_30_34_30]PIQ18605.1 MAG: sodium:solute symporter [Flavobacteriaceae bacterium CG18_big_fil_WC_8_21_14_2_50_34_36]PIV48666.1 MAG: sodium:solute symporter [Flavobacteriaceae bacterium CG02_land_8_20_14_3_00_34_13]PIX08422.1 MAG: sodium:solute symporter [Flavobacteriaceae bacterium CG_4_8_14_3_um_filter_34_10]PIZ07707.1 MAG: sodium:solute symporter [Flavobac
MPFLDILVFIIYLALVLGIGFYFYRKNQNTQDYYVGGRDMKSFHVGLSVVATDVGGGFSIGLGGLGFVMGISGSWMLFTGLIGAWLSAVFLIPKVIHKGHKLRLLTFPQLLKENYGVTVAFVAGVISFIGYLGFTSSQLLAGAKLAVGTFPALNLLDALYLMGAVAIVYTVFGGIKAVIYTDTFQWSILIIGLIFVGIPFAYFKLGGWDAIQSVLPNKFFSLTNLRWVQFANWFITIVPIWFVGMTLYQRIYACKDEKTAKKAWYIAGLFEWPVMAFMGIALGLLARVGAEQGLFIADGFAQAATMDPEIGLPLLLKNILPAGLLGLMMAAYFSAIMSTADSCLLASSGNFVTDILNLKEDNPRAILISQVATFVIGFAAILIASYMTSVLDLMLLSYAFMVSGLLVPVLGMLWSKKKKPLAALLAMLFGGFSTLILTFLSVEIPFGFDPILIGILISLFLYLIVKK